MYDFLLLWKMAWRNLWRQRRRSLITVFAMSAGLAMCIPTYGMVEWVSREMIRGITRTHLGHVQVHHPDYLEERRLELAFPEAEATKAVAAEPAVLHSAPRVYTGGMVSSEHAFELEVRAGEAEPKGALLRGGPPKSPCEALVDEGSARRWRLDLGSHLRFVPLPPAPACESVRISGVTASAPGDPVLTLAPGDFQRLAVPTGPVNGGGRDLDDIDALEKITPEGPTDTTPTPTPIPTPTPTPTSTPIPTPLPLKLKVVRTASSQVAIIAVEPGRERQVTSMSEKVVAGAYLSGTYRNGQGIPQILIGDQLARILMVKPGDRLGLDILTRDGFPLDEMVEVAGLFNSGMDNLDRSMTFVHLRMAWDPQLMNLVDPATGAPQVHELAVRLDDGADNVAVAARLEKRLAALRLSAWPWQKVEPAMASLVKMQDASVAILLVIILAIAALGTMNTMLMSVFERIREFGVLKSVGMRPWFVARLILLETTLMTFVSMVVGGALGLGITYWLKVRGLDFTSIVPDGFSYQGIVIDPVWRAVVTPRTVAVPLILMTVVSLIVAVWPAVRAARIKPVEALRQTGV